MSIYNKKISIFKIILDYILNVISFIMILNSILRLSIGFLILIISICFNGIFAEKNTNINLISDSRKSFFLFDKTKYSYTEYKQIKPSRYNSISIGLVEKPVFFIEEKNIYLSKNCEIIENVLETDKANLIKLKCTNLSLVPETYKRFHKFHVVSMTLINDRRWQVTILKKQKFITIDFPSGTPDVKNFEELDAKYDLTSKYTNIDLRFNNKIGII